MTAYINLSGKTYGRLTVLEEAGRNKQKRVTWLCECSCGNRVEVAGNNLQSGNSQSCGCLQKELQSDRAATHHQSQSRTYRIWGLMKRRCTDPKNPAYVDYGARGITVCERWMKFENFLADMGEAPHDKTLDRVDNNRGYGPNNCRWADRKQQARNTRVNRLLTYRGQTKCSAEWAEVFNIPRARVEARIDKLGWSVEDALTTPVWSRRKYSGAVNC